MREFVPALDSEYIIDGARMELTPRQILEEAVGEFHRSHPAANLEHDDYQTDTDKPTGTAAEPLIDESVDPSPESNAFSSEKIFEYLGEVTSSTLKPRNIPRFYPEETTRAEIATGLIRTIWKTGHFRLDDLIIDITWEWETSDVGVNAGCHTVAHPVQCRNEPSRTCRRARNYHAVFHEFSHHFETIYEIIRVHDIRSLSASQACLLCQQ